MSNPHPDKDRRYCTATAKRTGKRCGQPAMQGSNVCRMHGGAAAQVKAAAARRIAEAAAQTAAAQVYMRNAADMPENPLEALKALTRQLWAVNNDLFGRIAANPERFSELLPASVGTMAKLNDLLTAWARIDPPTQQGIRTVQDLLNVPAEFTLNLDPDSGWTPTPRPALPPAPQNEVAPGAEPSDVAERQDGHGSASSINPRTGRPWKTDSTAADEVEAEVLKRSPWRRIPGTDLEEI